MSSYLIFYYRESPKGDTSMDSQQIAGDRSPASFYRDLILLDSTVIPPSCDIISATIESFERANPEAKGKYAFTETLKAVLDALHERATAHWKWPSEEALGKVAEELGVDV